MKVGFGSSGMGKEEGLLGTFFGGLHVETMADGRCDSSTDQLGHIGDFCESEMRLGGKPEVKCEWSRYRKSLFCSIVSTWLQALRYQRPA